MSYQVLARKWRPRSFSQLIGQAHVVRALSNALDSDRVHHAFLFTGTRGVGKTTIARILAKCLNCEAGVSSVPCGECGACQEIDEGRFVDLLEVDAASRSKVDETRELMDNVQFLPGRGRFKVYLIDEVHMFSEKSFNALLKTLEEPPPHVKFLLATTDPQKLPITVLSRCLQFNLKRLPKVQIAEYLGGILDAEKVPADLAAAKLIAAAADGSMRDALSLLDQAIAYGNGELRLAPTRDMLGTLERSHLHALLQALAARDGAALMARVAVMAEEAVDFSDALAELISALHAVAVVQVVPDTIDADAEDVETIHSLAQRMSREDVQLFYQIGLHSRRDLPLARDAREGFEMAMLRMIAFAPPGSESLAGGQPGSGRNSVAKTVQVSTLAATLPAAPTSGLQLAAPVTHADAERIVVATSVVAGPLSGASTSMPSTSASAVESPALAIDDNAGSVDSNDSESIVVGNWAELVTMLNVSGMPRELANNCILKEVSGSVLDLELRPEHEQLMGERIVEKLKLALEHYYRKSVQLRIAVGQIELETPADQYRRHAAERQAQAVRSIESDVGVQAICDTFAATIDKAGIRPAD